MPLSDIFAVLRFWGALFLVGTAAFPLTKFLFGGHAWPKLRGVPFVARVSAKPDEPAGEGWFDGGYFFSKAVGMATVPWLIYALGTLRILPFSMTTVVVALAIIFLLGIVLHFRFSNFKLKAKNFPKSLLRTLLIVLLEEALFLSAFFAWSWVKAHEPSIRGLEKFMDYGFMQSILNARYFPPADMWYAGGSINYYYFGHLVTAVLTRLSGLDLSITFNLMLATIFALCLTMSFSIGYQLFTCQEPSNKFQKSSNFKYIQSLKCKIWNVCNGALTAFLVTLSGNMQTIYAFTRGYVGENVVPFWSVTWALGEFWSKLPEGLNRYWYPNATRFIPFTIHEFPSYSFVVSDVHGHVLSIPFVLLVIGLLIAMTRSIGFMGNSRSMSSSKFSQPVHPFQISNFKFQIIFYGFLVGILLMTNAIDGPIYLGLLAVTLGMFKFQNSRVKWKNIVTVLTLAVIVAGTASAPFLAHFDSFVKGVAVNCPPSWLANSQIGPVVFEGVEKCQRSPLWMLALLWGFFVYCGVWLVGTVFGLKATLAEGIVTLSYDKGKKQPVQILLVVFFFFSLLLILFSEFFYFKDIYPAHFRSNTMFKLGYQAFIMLSIMSGYTIVRIVTDAADGVRGKKIFMLLLIPQLFLVSIYPIFSVRSYFNSLRNYEGIAGLGWMAREYPEDLEVITWLKERKSQVEPSALVEADGESYTDYGRLSAFTGIPAVMGWPVHEWLWRGSYDIVAPRREDVQKLYETEDPAVASSLLAKYRVRYVFVGSLERTKYPLLSEEKFVSLGEPVFVSGSTVLYEFDIDNMP